MVNFVQIKIEYASNSDVLHIQRPNQCIRKHEHNIAIIYTGWYEQKNT